MPIVKNGVVEINPDKLSGAPVFAGTRVPIKIYSIISKEERPWKTFSEVSRLYTRTSDRCLRNSEDRLY